jgi:putative membrane protein
MLSAEKLFTQTDRDRISAAVVEAERKTSGEIVPFVVDQSDDYEEAEWRLGALTGVLLVGVLAAVYLFTPAWLPWNFAEWLLVILAGFGLGMAAARFLLPVRRAFAGRRMIERRVGQRAAQAFIAEEVFNTRDRTGILLFVSLLERRVIVLGDSGINAKVQQGEWQGVVDTVIEGLATGRPAEGLIAAIGKCGALLERKGVAVKSDDRDELPDALRVRPS